MHIYGPAVNRKLFLGGNNAWNFDEDPYVGYNYEARQFIVIPEFSNKNITTLLSINKKSISIYKYSFNASYI